MNKETQTENPPQEIIDQMLQVSMAYEKSAHYSQQMRELQSAYKEISDEAVKAGTDLMTEHAKLQGLLNVWRGTAVTKDTAPELKAVPDFEIDPTKGNQ